MNTRETRIFAVLGIMISLSLLPLWLNENPPLQDYPPHLLNVQIIKNYSNPIFDYSENFKINPVVVSNFVFELLTLTITNILPLTVAGKITLSIYLIMFPISIAYLVWQIDKKRIINSLFAPIFSYNWFFNMGFVNFFLSIPLFFFAIGYWWKNKDCLGKRQLITLTFLVTATFITHLVSFAVLGFSLFVLSALHYKNLRKATISLISAAPSILLLAYKFLSLPSVEKYAPVYLIHDLIKYLPRPFYSFSKIELSGIFALSAMFTAFVWVKISKRQMIENKIFAVLMAILFLLYLVLPFGTANSDMPFRNYFSFWPINLRVLIFLAPLPLLIIKIPKNTKKAFVVLSIALLLINLYSIQSAFQENNVLIKAYLNGVKVMEPNKTIFNIPSVLCTDYETVLPLEHYYAFYHIEKGGTSPHLFARFDYDLIKFNNSYVEADLNVFRIDFEKFDYTILCDDPYVEKFFKLTKYPVIFNENRIKIYKTGS